MILRRWAGFIFSRWRDPGRCEACGSPFVCGAGLAGCWCRRISLPESTRRDLRGRFSGCLCRPCLERAAAGGLPQNGRPAARTRED